MEIERKFLISEFPKDLKEIKTEHMYQGYISTNPVVRIRESIDSVGGHFYILCFKGKGQLVREEIELPLERDTFEKLKTLLTHDMIHKEWHAYEFGKDIIECNKVDYKGNNEFLYAEVEFNSTEEAENFVIPPFFIKDVTEETGYTMKDYWERINRDE